MKLNFLLWSILVLLSILSFDIKIISLFTYVVFSISIFSTLIKPKNHLIVLPFFAFLSPIAGYQSINLLFSDYYFCFLLVHIIWMLLTKKIKLFKSQEFYILSTIFSLYVLSVVIGNLIGNLTSFKPLIYPIQFALIFIITVSFANSKKWSYIVLKSWILTVFLGSLLIINSYLNGIELINFSNNLDNRVNVNDISYLFRGSFYYAGFGFSLGIVLLCLIIKQFFLTKIYKKIIIFLLTLYCFLTLFIISNKTVFVSILLALCIFVLKYYNFFSKKTKRNLLSYLLLFSLIIPISIFFIISKFENNQILYLLVSIENLSSLSARFIIYKIALLEFISNPIGLIFGMGPDFLESASSINYKTLVSGYSEGTVDSGLISYLIELGLINFSLLIYFIYRSIKISYRASLQTLVNNDTENNISLYIFVSIIFLFFALSTQMLGYTKTSWLPFQLLLLGSLNQFNFKKKYE